MRPRSLDPSLFAGLLLVSMYLVLAAGINRGDEAWFLQVTRRILSGERLYGDIFYGAGPVAVYLTTPFIRLFGVEVFVVKGVTAASYATSLLLGIRVLRKLDVSPRLQALSLALNLVLAPPQSAAPYQTLATTFSMAAFDATLTALTGHDHRCQNRAALLAGIWAGLALSTKQNVGAYLILVVAGVTSLPFLGPTPPGERARLWRRLRACTGGFVIGAGLPFLPVFFQDSVLQFLDYGVLNKTTYLQLSGISYLAGIAAFFRALRTLLADPAAAEQVIILVRLSSFLLVPAVGLLGAFTLARASPERRWKGLVAALFAAVSLLAVFPRADYTHLAYPLPGMVVFGVWVLGEWQHTSGSDWKGRLVRGTGVICQVSVVSVLLLLLALPGLRLTQGRLVVSRLPHFRGAIVSPAWQDTARREATALASLHDLAPVFLLHPLAGFYYLLADLHNPTPFDFPLATAFGRQGQQQVISALENGEIRAVCWEAWDWNLRPALLEEYVASRFEPVRRVGPCTLYLPQPLGAEP